MICPACGAANEDGVPFCETCKADLEMPAVAPSSLMTESVYSTPVDEPIPLEPIQLEPVEEAPAVSQAEPVTATLESTGDHPVIPAPPPFPSGPSDDFPTAEPAVPGATPKVTVAPSAAANPKLVVVRGQRIDVQYPIYPGKNFMGRTDDKPVDIDIEDQESADRIWSSRQHAVITFEEGKLVLEDLNSLNGTFVNRTRVHPGQMKELQANDVIQIGTVHMKLVLE
mgnify:CR=1 FL=1